MSRLLLIALLVLALPLSTFAGEKQETSCAGLSVESLARLMLEDAGPQQALVAQGLRDADQKTLVALQKALREIAPQLEKEKQQRGPEPDPTKVESGPLDLVTIEVRFLDVMPNFLKDVGVDMGGKGARSAAP